MMRSLGSAAAAAMVIMASPGVAQNASFTLTGAHTASFTLPLTPTDIDPAGHDDGLDDPTIFAVTSTATVDGMNSPVLFHFYTDDGGGGLDVISLGTTFFRFSPAGRSVFTGTIYNPTFVPDEYDFYDFETEGLFYHLSITTDAVARVPEPMTWAMMLAGFGGVGLAMRRRTRARTTVSLA